MNEQPEYSRAVIERALRMSSEAASDRQPRSCAAQRSFTEQSSTPSWCKTTPAQGWPPRLDPGLRSSQLSSHKRSP
jgi:hypothetical protein